MDRSRKLLAFGVWVGLLITLSAGLAVRDQMSIAKRAAPIIQIQQGAVQGIVQQDAYQYLGIPYAAPPLGRLRWAPPQPPQSWSGVLNATRYAQACTQIPNPLLGFDHSVYNEDCLYANVFLPLDAFEGSPLPVMVWIHGGAFRMGSGEYSAQNIASQGNVIVVTFNYRLSLFGFLTFDAIEKENGVNCGLQDQLELLSWVRMNIKAFHGDPGRVTIFGESAGAQSVSMHLIGQQSWPLYQAAILESPAPWTFSNSTVAGQQALAFAENTPCPLGNGQALLRCLRSLSTRQLMDLAVSSGIEPIMIPSIDGKVVPMHPAVAWQRGLYNKKVAILLGSNYDEGTVFTFVFTQMILNKTTTDNLTESDYNTLISIIVQPPPIQQFVLKLYADVAQSQGYFQAFSQIMGDLLVDCGTNIISDALFTNKQAFFRYLFAEPVTGGPLDGLGATHASELPYVFDNSVYIFNMTFSTAQQNLARTTISYWTNFATTYNPNSSPNFYWPPTISQPLDSQILLLNASAVTLTAGDWRKWYCDKWIATGFFNS